MRAIYLFGLGLFIATGMPNIARATGLGNLKGLNDVAIAFVQPRGRPVISHNAMLQLDKDIKLKLQSAGITVTSQQDAKAIFDINIQNIVGGTNESILVQILVLEVVNTTARESSKEFEAITYMDQDLCDNSLSNADSKIRDVTLNKLVTKFASQYREQNSK